MKISTQAFVIALSLLISTAASAATKNAEPHPKITRNTITVAAANDEWTSTTIKVEAGDILLIHATGEIVVGNYLGKTTADGTNNGIGRLQLKIGQTDVIPVGSVRYVPVTEAGTAKLRVDDTNYRDNSGEFSVEVIHIPAAIIPEATPITADN